MSKSRISRANLIYVGPLVVLAAPAAAMSPCDFLSGAMKSLCQSAAQHKQQAPQQAPQQSATPVANSQIATPVAIATPAPQTATPANAAPAARSQPAPKPAVNNPDAYDSKSFSGLSTWAQMFDKEVNSPAEFATFMAKMNSLASGPESKMQSFAMGPKRNNYEKILTDYRLYKGYYPSAATLLAKQHQCMAPRSYSAAEVCDCVAGFPGDTAIGPGAGELVTGSNATMAVAACGHAADIATDSRSKARFTAQRARAQIYKMDTAQAAQWADQAIAGGYRRALIVKASTGLRDIEVLSSGFPPMSQAQFNASLQSGVDALKVAKKAGVWETFIVAQQYHQTLDHIALNSALLKPLIKAMMAPPPSSPCGPDSRDNEGKPIAGSGCIGHSFGG